MKRYLPVLLLILSACASQPAPVQPAALKQYNAHAVAAQRAAMTGAWADAAAQWQEALLLSAAVDDWAGQGEARLGLANAQVELTQREAARQTIAPMPGQMLFPRLQRSRAHYQLALLALPDAHAAADHVQQARALCDAPCGLRPWFDNLDARIALAQQDGPRAAALASAVTAQADAPASERAHGWRLLAEAQLLQNQGAAAWASLQSALVLDRQLAVPAWLADDFALQVRIGQQLQRADIHVDAQTRLDSLCAAASVPACAARPAERQAGLEAK
ncbi:hypothetical protein JCM19000A_13050 [Silvimonas sp. JCM 19000]